MLKLNVFCSDRIGECAESDFAQILHVGHARNEQVPAVAFGAVACKVSKGAKLVLAIDYGTQ
jgi:hypothetical protein